MNIKKFVRANSGLLSNLYWLLMNNKIIGKKGNHVQRHNLFARKMHIRFYGTDNEIILGGGNPSLLTACHIEIHGSHNKVIVEGGVGASNLTLYCADDNCLIHVKENTQISGKTELAVMEGTKIVIGSDCLFSANITMRAGDSHSVVDAESGIRLNPSKDIIVGNHVWIGNTVIVTKGTVIGGNSVVATGSVLAGKTFPANSAIGGNPAKVIKEGVNWKAEKI